MKLAATCGRSREPLRVPVLATPPLEAGNQRFQFPAHSGSSANPSVSPACLPPPAGLDRRFKRRVSDGRILVQHADIGTAAQRLAAQGAGQFFQQHVGAQLAVIQPAIAF